MPLADVQRALAHAFTNDDVHDTLRRDPAGFARTFDLSQTELESIASIADHRMRGFTSSLDRKRASECARLLPRSAEYLGPRFRRECLRFARRLPLGDGPQRYRTDAVAFARYLLRLRDTDALDKRAREVLAHEAGWSFVVRFAGRDLRFSWPWPPENGLRRTVY